LELGGVLVSKSNLYNDHCLVLICGSVFLVALVRIGQTGMHVVEPILLNGIPIFYFLGKFINDKKQLVNICASATQTKIQPRKRVCTMLLSDQNGSFSLEYLWDLGGLISLGWHLQQLEEIMSTTNSVPVVVSGQQSVDESACDSFEHSIDQFAIEESQGCVLFLQPKPPWSILAPNILMTVSECTTSPLAII
jgi:hypothetical protein